jgi:hypothetical protein
MTLSRSNGQSILLRIGKCTSQPTYLLAFWRFTFWSSQLEVAEFNKRSGPGGCEYLLWTLRFSSSKKLRFEDQIETFTHFLRDLRLARNPRFRIQNSLSPVYLVLPPRVPGSTKYA